MIAEFHNRLGSPEQVECTRLVLRDSPDGEALCVAIEAGPRQWYIVHRGDGDEAMNKALQALGVNETIISDMVDAPTPPGKLWTPNGG